jgi:Flp pilus assembly pilin Flp
MVEQWWVARSASRGRSTEGRSVPSSTIGAGSSAPAGRRLRTAFARAATDDRGAATAEYAIITVAAVGIAGLLAVVLRSDEVRSLLTDLVHRALTLAG